MNQRGAALITGLIFLVVLTLLGVAALQMSSMEEKMAGNLRDRSLAIQAAEMALRRAERQILNPTLTSGTVGFSNTCANGLCDNGQGVAFPTPVWWPVAGNWDNPARHRAYDDATVTGIIGAPPTLPAGVPVPTYLIEGIYKQPVLPSFPGGYFYRITARAQGVNPGTVVMLQEVFKP